MATLTMHEEFGAFSRERRAGRPQVAAARLRAQLSSARRSAESRGNQRRAARQLGILPTTLHEKMKRLGCGPTSSCRRATRRRRPQHRTRDAHA
jgi:DNA-binding NtrC family response regulator